MPTTLPFETRCREIGLEIFERARAAGPQIWRQAWWQQTFTNLSMQYETLKVQLFRFIDVLPTLRTDSDIARHLKEYLDPDRLDMPKAMALMLGYRSPHSLHARVVAGAARRAALLMARRFIAGSNAPEAVVSIERFRRGKKAFTIDVLGEYTAGDEQADRYQHTYLDLIESLCPVAETWTAVPVIDYAADGPMPRVNISIKLSALDPNFDAIDFERAYDTVGRRLRPILRRAGELGAFINVDMESFAYRDLTVELFMRLFTEDEFREMQHVGIAIQAYLRDGERDYERLLEWVKRRGAPIAIRLVKGAYWDMETAMAVQNNAPPPVWTHKWESDACFERLTARMLENHRWIRPAFASHNVRSLAVVLARAEQLGLTSRHYEIQMLNGMGDPLKSAVVGMGQCLRIYTPYGELIPGMGYLIRRLLENTANDSFLRQDFSGGAALRRLLIDPALARPLSTQPRQVRFGDIKEDEAMSTFRNEPNTNFGDQPNRTKYAQALAYVRKESGKEYPLVIGGQPVRTDAHFDSINPARPWEVVGKIALATPADADHAVAAARRALPGWREVRMTERAQVLCKAADIIRRRRFEMAATMTLEVGKPWREADADVSEALDYLVYYALQAERIGARPRRRDLPGEDNVLIYEPKGVCVVLSPWSFPLALLTNMTAAALVTGNTVVMKPSSHAAVIAAKLYEVFEQVGLPPGVLNYLPGPGDRIGSHLVRHPEVHVIAYTGSRQVGLEVLRAAADAPPTQQHIKKVIAEFGGKNAIIVDGDADLDEAVGGVVKSAFGYSGQKCTACSRVVVLKDVYDVFCKRLVDAVGSLAIGSPDEPGTIIGPVIDAQAQETMRRWIETGRTEGRIILERDATSVDGEGFYVAPTIIADVDPNASVAQHELFGPVLVIIPADDFGHALEIANGTPYALTGGVYSRSPHNIEQAKREFLVGNLYINRKITGSRVDVQPFGGLKLSGDGAKAGGPDYLHEFCNARTITEHTLRHGLAPAQEVQTTV